MALWMSMTGKLCVKFLQMPEEWKLQWAATSLLLSLDSNLVVLCRKTSRNRGIAEQRQMHVNNFRRLKDCALPFSHERLQSCCCCCCWWRWWWWCWLSTDGTIGPILSTSGQMNVTYSNQLWATKDSRQRGLRTWRNNSFIKKQLPSAVDVWKAIKIKNRPRY